MSFDTRGTFKLSDRGRRLVEALPDRDKVKRLQAKWRREDRKKARRVGVKGEK